ncbi:phage repressor protein CI [Phytobacter diazotrophicus]|uniref:phage repressor protein CI n=1 Tax=Phytobacter diazotrophicus TaxID=395631 RepID=UPI002FF12F14
MDLKTGGQKVITRIVEAYGFKTRQALCNQLGVSTSTMGTRWMRDVFPADWIVQCSIETGASVEWLAFGKGEAFPHGNKNFSNGNIRSANENALSDVITVPKKKIVDGNLYSANFFMLDKAMLPSHIIKPIIVVDDSIQYLAEENSEEISDGTWLVEIEGKVSIKELMRIPVGKVRVNSPEGGHYFECGVRELKALAKCHFYLMTNV